MEGDDLSSAGADFAAVFVSVAAGIGSTFAVAGDLDAATVRKNFVVFVTMGG